MTTESKLDVLEGQRGQTSISIIATNNNATA